VILKYYIIVLCKILFIACPQILDEMMCLLVENFVISCGHFTWDLMTYNLLLQGKSTSGLPGVVGKPTDALTKASIFNSSKNGGNDIC